MDIIRTALLLVTALLLLSPVDSIDVADINRQGPKIQKYNASKNLLRLSTLDGPVKVETDGNNAIEVLYGRIDPACDPDLVTYQKCWQEELPNSFVCPDEPTVFLLVKTANKVHAINATYKPYNVELDEFLQEELKEDLERRKTILAQVSKGGQNKLPNYKHTGYYVSYGSNVIPLSVSPGNKAEIIAAVSEVGSGRILWFARPQYALDLGADGTPMSALRENILAVCGSGAVSFKHLIKNSFPDPLPDPSKAALYWSPFHERLNEAQVQRLLGFVRDSGGCLIIGLDSWSYKVYVAPYASSVLRPLFVAGGIWPGNYNHTVFVSLTPFDLGGKDALEAQQADAENFLRRALATGLPQDCTQYAVYFEEVPLESDFGAEIAVLYSDVMKQYRYHLDWLTPCSAALVSQPDRRQQMTCLSVLLANSFFTSINSSARVPIPGVLAFPGPVPPLTPRKAFKLQLTSARAANEVLPTGLYLAPGETAKVRVVYGEPSGWTVATMWPSIDIQLQKNFFKRWPLIRSFEKLGQGQISFFSSFGGLLWLMSPKSNASLVLEVSNVIEAPSFDTRIKWKHGQKDWNVCRTEKSTPWGHLGGSFVNVVAPSGAFRELSNPKATTDKLDRCVRAQRWLTGTEDIKRHREVISTDVQINAGYMHAGYPIMGPLSLVEATANFLKPETRNRMKDWGIFHELGHNQQQNIWTMSNYGEVTNNILTTFCDYLINGRSAWAPTNSWLQEHLTSIQNYLQGDNINGGPYQRLGVYTQFQSAFGWLGLRRTLRSYVTNLDKAPTSDQEKFDAWYLRSSNVTRMDLAPFYLFWFWPISSKAQASMAHLPAFLPDDFATQWAPTRVNDLTKRFGARLTRTPTVIKPAGEKEDIANQTAPVPAELLVEITPL